MMEIIDIYLVVIFFVCRFVVDFIGDNFFFVFVRNVGGLKFFSLGLYYYNSSSYVSGS